MMINDYWDKRLHYRYQNIYPDYKNVKNKNLYEGEVNSKNLDPLRKVLRQELGADLSDRELVEFSKAVLKEYFQWLDFKNTFLKDSEEVETWFDYFFLMKWKEKYENKNNSHKNLER